MRKLALIVFILTSFSVVAQSDSLAVDSGYQKKKIPKNQIKALYGFLGQDGNHSAVTGGIGTEELQVHSTRVVYVKKVPKNQKWLIKTGVDKITSASTDNIDFFESSASRKDYRVQANVGKMYTDSVDSNAVGYNVSASLESDYLSRGLGAFYKHKNKWGGFTELKANFFWDELRWGLVTAGVFDFTKMVYPMELRDTSWFDISHRNTFTFSTKHSFITSYRSKLGFMLDATFQQGVLSTPFHRVYDKNDELRVEKLPTFRVRLPFAVEFNYFLGSGIVLKNYFRYSWDSFQMNAYTYKLQTPIKINYLFWLKPFARVYYQNAANYFAPYQQGDFLVDEYYTSDFDLSSFWAINYGLGIKMKKKASWENLNGMELLIENYNREDGLNFWQTTFMIDFSF